MVEPPVASIHAAFSGRVADAFSTRLHPILTGGKPALRLVHDDLGLKSSSSYVGPEVPFGQEHTAVALERNTDDIRRLR